jgi:hypothetical protein
MREAFMWNRIKWALALAAVPAVAGYLGCGLDDPNIPELAGPSTLAQDLTMRAIPDQLTADGRSSSVIEAVLRDENGQPVSGETVNFDLGVRSEVSIFGGTFQDIGGLSQLNGAQPAWGIGDGQAVSASTNSSGVAKARYWAPFRTDQVNDIIVTITGRPAGVDFRAARLRQVDIFLRAADRSEFPGGEACAFILEPQKSFYLVNEQIDFTATQLTGPTGRTIARYEWDFGDGEHANGRRAGHAYELGGTYTVFLITTEAVTGSVNVCSDTIPVTTP